MKVLKDTILWMLGIIGIIIALAMTLYVIALTSTGSGV
jgi:hypothetical protein